MESKWLRYKYERRFDAFVWDACTWTTCDIKLDVDNTKSYLHICRYRHILLGLLFRTYAAICIFIYLPVCLCFIAFIVSHFPLQSHSCRVRMNLPRNHPRIKLGQLSYNEHMKDWNGSLLEASLTLYINACAHKFSGLFPRYPSFFVSTHLQVWSDARHAEHPLSLEWNATLNTTAIDLSLEQ